MSDTWTEPGDIRLQLYVQVGIGFEEIAKALSLHGHSRSEEDVKARTAWLDEHRGQIIDWKEVEPHGEQSLAQWVRNLLDQGLQPELRLIGEFDTEEEAAAQVDHLNQGGSK